MDLDYRSWDGITLVALVVITLVFLGGLIRAAILDDNEEPRECIPNKYGTAAIQEYHDC